MRLKTLTLLLCALGAAAACGAGGDAQNAAAPQTAATPAPAPGPPLPRSATCLLLSDEELQEVQGEAPSDAQGSEHAAGGLSMSQCFFRLPTFSKSISLEVVRAEPGAPAGALKEYWRKRFHPDAIEARELQRQREEEATLAREERLKREREAGQVREGGRRKKKDKEAEDARPERVRGVGQEAYWSGNQTTAALYVLGKGAVVRVSLGAGEEQDVKIKKASELARKVLKRLGSR
ncbi:MAG TPA: hypothetical protein VF611_06690 [Pyrinomonadaceae bacterium]|jgi:type IV secretory pathway VirB10-like protein